MIIINNRNSRSTGIERRRRWWQREKRKWKTYSCAHRILHGCNVICIQRICPEARLSIIKRNDGQIFKVKTKHKLHTRYMHIEDYRLYETFHFFLRAYIYIWVGLCLHASLRDEFLFTIFECIFWAAMVLIYCSIVYFIR